jgi:hypothetical protein
VPSLRVAARLSAGPQHGLDDAVGALVEALAPAGAVVTKTEEWLSATCVPLV